MLIILFKWNHNFNWEFPSEDLSPSLGLIFCFKITGFKVRVFHLVCYLETNLPVQMQNNILYSVRGMCVFFLRYLQDFNGVHAQCPYCLQAATVLSIVLVHYFFVKNSPDCPVNGCVWLTVQCHPLALSNRPHTSWGKLQPSLLQLRLVLLTNTNFSGEYAASVFRVQVYRARNWPSDHLPCNMCV